MLNSNRFRLLAGILLLGAMAWWFYPRQPPRVWYNGTAPNPERLAAERPTVELLIDKDYLERAEVLVDGTAAGTQEITLRANSMVPVRGFVELHHVQQGSTLVAIQFSVLSRDSNPVGMLAEGQTVVTAKETRSEDRLRAEFSDTWTVPDHLGEFFLIVEFHLFRPGDRTAPRRFAVVCPVRITSG